MLTIITRSILALYLGLAVTTPCSSTASAQAIEVADTMNCKNWWLPQPVSDSFVAEIYVQSYDTITAISAAFCLSTIGARLTSISAGPLLEGTAGANFVVDYQWHQNKVAIYWIGLQDFLVPSNGGVFACLNFCPDEGVRCPTIVIDTCFVEPAGTTSFLKRGGQYSVPSTNFPVLLRCVRVENELDTAVVAASLDLISIYPNPFNSGTTISVAVTQGSEVSITIYDVLGRRVREYSSIFAGKGVFKCTWDGKDERGIDAASGVYLVLVETPSGKAIRKALLLR
jgi:hypothetical protein